jgi:hypothetical protein
MKPLALILSFVFCLNSSAQKYGISIESGPSIGIFPKNLTDAAFKSETSYSLGHGMTNTLGFQVFPDSSSWYFSAGLQLFQGSQVTTAYAGDDSGNYNANSRSVNSLRFQAQLAYSFKIGKLKLDLRAGFLLPVYSRTKEFQYRKDTSFNAMTTVQIQQYPSLGFIGGLNLNGSLIKNNKLRWFLNIDLSVLNSSVKRAEVVYYKDSKNASLDEVFSSTSSKITEYRKDPTEIRNNEAVLPNRFDRNQATDKLTYMQSMNAFNIRFGFQFLF